MTGEDFKLRELLELIQEQAIVLSETSEEHATSKVRFLDKLWEVLFSSRTSTPDLAEQHPIIPFIRDNSEKYKIDSLIHADQGELGMSINTFRFFSGNQSVVTTTRELVTRTIDFVTEASPETSPEVAAPRTVLASTS